MNMYRVIQAYLIRKAGPVVQMDHKKLPKFFEPENRGARDYGINADHYWKFHDEHEVELTEKENLALWDYKKSGFLYMNHYLRKNKHHPELSNDKDEQERIEDQIDHLDQAIDKSWMRKPVVLWRALAPNEDEPLWARLLVLGSGKLPDAKNIHKIVGYKFTEPGFVSTSLMQVTDSLVLRIILEKGQRGLLMNSSYNFYANLHKFVENWNMPHSNEHEVLLPAGTKFEVVSARLRSPGKIQVTVRVID